ncbi:NACHT and TPR domain protein [Aspergillus alliaceus]|uniref:NACHT and TPR domain protein n=1 Tax=Petromyces alliaceus TaxID=209559 RepID=A0A5N7BTN6_PETAA|nr:NACHT and TPR domain protein [Aspergillus alliaceus]
MANLTFSAIYENAIRKYHEITGETLEVDLLTGIRSVSDLTKEIDERNRAFREFREKRGAIFDVLEATLIPVQLFGNLAAGGASMVFPPSSLVFGAVMHLVGAAKGVSASYEAIQDLMQMLQDFTIRLKVYTQEALSEVLSDKLSDIIVTLIEIFALSSKIIRRGRLLKFTRNILLGNDDTIKAAIVRLDKLTQAEANLVRAETLTESKRAGRVVDGISVTVNATNATVLETGMTVNRVSAQVYEVQEMLEKLIVSANEEKPDTRENQEALQELINRVLRPSKVDSAQEWFDKIHKARVPGTGDWVHSEDVFQSWINKETPVIFVSGNPGAGKSFLAANMISFLLKRFCPGLQRNPVTSIGYFFFKGDNPQTRSFHQALRDLAFQISKSDPWYRKYLATIAEYEQISTLESAWRLLFVEYFLKKPNIESTAYILLDAVDETLDEERRIFVDLAKDLYCNQSRLQLAIVGRPYLSDQLLEGLEVKVPTLHVTKQKNSGDISQYIHVNIKKSLVLRRVSPTLRDEIIDKLSAGAEGMFLWVNLMLQELVKKRNETSMRKALEQAPRGLKEMLRHVLATFSRSSNEEELEYLNETLLWVTCANQPWSLAEIEAILRLKSPEGDGIIDLEGAIRRQWASFFTLHREDGLTTAELENRPAYLDAFDWGTDKEKQDEYESSEEDYFMAFNSKRDTTTVTFCHASIGDFLRDESEGKVSATESHIGVGVYYHEAKIHILRTYLRLITNPEFAIKANDSGHMLQNAARHWGDHLLTTFPSKCSLEDRREIAKMLLTAFRSEEAMTNWLGEGNWALPTATIKAVRQWWQEHDVHEFLSPEEKEFISTTESESGNLLKPMIMFCIKRWLWEDQPNPVPMVSIVWRYQMLVKGKEVHDYDRNITAEEVIEAAEFGGFEQTSRWFRQCAIALRQFCCYEEALEYFKKAMELNPDDWRTLRELAQTYQEQGDWQKSTELWKRTRLCLLTAIAESPEDGPLKGHLHECLERMGQIYEEQGDQEKRFEAVQEAYQYAPSCWTCIYAILDYHNNNHAYKATMDLLKKLADTPVPEEDFSELTRFLLVNVFDVDVKSRLAADAALATDDLDFVLASLQTAARVARASSRTLIAAEVDMAIARIYDEFLLDHLKAIKCWEKTMDAYSSSSDGTLIGIIRQQASSKLAQAFLCNAVKVGVDTPEAEESGAKLEKLAQQSQAYSLGSCAFAPAVYLGIYCHLRGQDERARALFRPSLQRSIQTLQGDNPTNEELSDLQYTLMRAGDLKNVIAIAHRSEQDNSDPWYICRGPCRRKAPTRDGFSICPICLEGELCPDCVKLVESAIPKKRCNSQHVKYFISIPPHLKEIRSGMMLVDGEEMEFETWLNQLKKEWALDAHNSSDSPAARLGLGDFLLGVVA